MTIVERLARWAHDLLLDDVPIEVADLARAQLASTLGAAAASHSDRAAQRVLAAISDVAPEGDRPTPIPGKKSDLPTACYLWSVLSMALDFDDYVCFGHTSHSAAWASLLAKEGSGSDRLAAQIAAGEIEARLGGAALIGPLNGQLWSFIHSAGAAIATGKLMRLNEDQLAHALAIALHQPPRPTVPGFMAPDTKLLTAADPNVAGIRAAQLAAGGVTGPLDVLDRSRGFFEAVSYSPIRGLLGGLGDGWALRTLSVKPYPGCAYIDTTLDALFELPELDPVGIESIEVRAGMLTCGMDDLSSRYAATTPTPVTINFSIPWNVAVAVLARRVTPQEIHEDWLASNSSDLIELAGKVTLAHEASSTGRTAEAFAPVLPARLVAEDVGRAHLLRGLLRARKDHPGVRPKPSELRRIYRQIRTSDDGSRTFWDDAALKDFEMTFPSRVRVTMKGGLTHEAAVKVPRGGAGHSLETPAQVATWKLRTFGPALWGDSTETIERSVTNDPSALLALIQP